MASKSFVCWICSATPSLGLSPTCPQSESTASLTPSLLTYGNRLLLGNWAPISPTIFAHLLDVPSFQICSKPPWPLLPLCWVLGQAGELCVGLFVEVADMHSDFEGFSCLNLKELRAVSAGVRHWAVPLRCQRGPSAAYDPGAACMQCTQTCSGPK